MLVGDRVTFKANKTNLGSLTGIILGFYSLCNSPCAILYVIQPDNDGIYPFHVERLTFISRGRLLL